MMARRICIGLLFLLLASRGYSQDPGEDKMFTIDTPVNLDFEKEDEPINTKKKKKPKKKVFYGIKTKKGFTRRGVGTRTTIELFYYLKKPETTNTLVRDIYYYDYGRREIRKTANFDPKRGVLLHGPYKRMQNGILVETGIYYKGTRHGRWMTYNRDSVLVDKNRYFRGWPKESLVSYYDPTERKKTKEIIPIEFGEKEGNYYMFHENGKVAVTGEYQYNQRVGNWVEYYPDGKRKRIIAYPKEAFNKEVIPFIQAEWNDKGREIYRNNKAN